MAAYANGDLVGVGGAPNCPQPQWAGTCPPERREQIETVLAPARSEVLAWLAGLFRALVRLTQAAEEKAAARLAEANREVDAVLAAARRVGPEAAAAARRQIWAQVDPERVDRRRPPRLDLER